MKNFNIFLIPAVFGWLAVCSENFNPVKNYCDSKGEKFVSDEAYFPIPLIKYMNVKMVLRPLNRINFINLTGY